MRDPTVSTCYRHYLARTNVLFMAAVGVIHVRIIAKASAVYPEVAEFSHVRIGDGLEDERDRRAVAIAGAPRPVKRSSRKPRFRELRLPTSRYGLAN